MKDPSKIHETLENSEPGFIRIDIKYPYQMLDVTGRRYLTLRIDGPTRWVFAYIKSHKMAAATKLFLNALPMARLTKK